MYTDEKIEIVSKKLEQMFYKNFDKNDAKQLISLRDAYANVVSQQELISRDIIDFYGMIVNFWHFIQKRQSDHALVRVFNPIHERDGWNSSHTAIQVALPDSPFVVDSLVMLMARKGLGVHFVFSSGALGAKRDEKGQLEDLCWQKVNSVSRPNQGEYGQEAFIILEVDRQAENHQLFKALEHEIIELYKTLQVIVHDYPAMKDQMAQAVEILKTEPCYVSSTQQQESIDFLEFLENEHFVYEGYCEFDVQQASDGSISAVANQATSLGLFRHCPDYLNSDIYTRILNSHERHNNYELLTIEKADDESPIHRKAYMDIVSVPIYNEQGQLIKQQCFLGLYTLPTYKLSPRQIPFLRQRCQRILERSGFRSRGHNYNALNNILETFPRDEMFLSSEDELYETAMGIFYIRRRQVIKLFVRRDRFSRYYFCMLYMPRERYNSDVRKKAESILKEELGGLHITFKTHFLEDVLCRVDMKVYIDPNAPLADFDLAVLEEKLQEVERHWVDYLLDDLIAEYGEHRGRTLYNEYRDGFSPAYQHAYIPRQAVADIKHFEATKSRESGLSIALLRLLEEPSDRIRLKLYLRGQFIQLSDIMPILENLGMCVLEEKPYRIVPANGEAIWFSDFGVQVNGEFDLDRIRELLVETFSRIWAGQAENDRFNQLITTAELDWTQINVLRTYSKYLMQIGLRFSQSYIEDTLITYADIARQLVQLYTIRFDPEIDEAKRDQQQANLCDLISANLANVMTLAQDKILRRLWEAILATVRTNYYQKLSDGRHKPYLSIKLCPGQITDIPQPAPMFEIFMYSPRVEGVHLRCAKVARGGLRWSDRHDDYRTEILGLVKAQQVKNAVIVPLGAKGGFIAKKLPKTSDRDAIQQEAQACYRLFISSLLDLTDNIEQGQTVGPKNVVRHDDEDRYLVVAADKGTATFSDIANEVAASYNFWLGDAFASGGSNGYDHKKMGITARGAWESVKLHFRSLGKDIQSQPFTVAAIGDMSGDVFGNGMLLSSQIQLIAAFNHRHIFIDPNPNIQASYQERKRLFELGRSGWQDYDTSLISKGGGVFSRQSKSITLTPEIKQFLGTDANQLEPNELIRLILKADVELIWNGGIGTYVKASSESHEQADDRTNDVLRVNGRELRCKVFGEGGNLGLTQKGRIEFARNGGLINNDAIDNSAGVDCSDHEVNIKILLNIALESGELSQHGRNQQLESMADDVARLVLKNNYDQNKTIIHALANQTYYTIEAYSRLMRELETKIHLNRSLEYLPTDTELHARIVSAEGLTSPEFSVIMAYAKTYLKQLLLESDLPEDPYFTPYLHAEFPEVLVEKYGHLMSKHRLARQIIATQLTNMVVTRTSVMFVQRLRDETGAPVSNIIKAFCAISDIFNLHKIWASIDALNEIQPKVEQALLQVLFKFLRQATRWLLRHEDQGCSVQDLVEKYKAHAHEALPSFDLILTESAKAANQKTVEYFTKRNVPEAIAQEVTQFQKVGSVFDFICSISRYENPQNFFKVSCLLNDTFNLGWCIESVTSQTYWGALSLASLRDDFLKMEYELVGKVLTYQAYTDDPQQMLERWQQDNQSYVDRWYDMLEDIKVGEPRFETVFMAFKGMQELVENSKTAEESKL